MRGNPFETVALAWHCDGCGLVLANRTDWIEINCFDLTVTEGRPQRMRGISPSEREALLGLRETPRPVRWTAWHRECFPQDRRISGYRLPIATIRNLAQLIDLHSYLASKGFADFFDLRVFVNKGKVAGAVPGIRDTEGPLLVPVSVSI